MIETSKIVTPSENKEIERNITFENSANVSIKLDSEAGNNTIVDAATNTAPEEIEKILIAKNKIFSKCDIVTWPENMQNFNDDIIYWMKSGSNKVQNCNAK